MCTDDGDDRNAESICFSDCDLFFLDVDDKDGIGKTRHCLDTGKVLIKTLTLAIEFDAFLLGQFLVATVSLHTFEILEPFDRLLDRLKVSEQTTKPSLIDVILSALFRLFANGVLCLSLGADKENCFAFVFSDEIGHEGDCLAKHSLSLL